ncbi:MAG TPA: hypothetical protein PLY94_12060 [Gemmatimonadaceae bacterium]|nr:hypothetical protein [Gemmatimonadaceae bacterium]
MSWLRAPLVGAVAWGAVACAGGGDSPAGPTMPPPVPPPPAPVYDATAWVTASDGTIPVVIVAPHGGDLNPDSLPFRSCSGCVTGNDLNTQALAIEIADEFERRIGRRPFLVINRLHRNRFDGNREQAEATDSYAPLFPVWDHWQASIDSARVRAARVHPRAILIDLHGHGHAIPRIELGYLLSASQLRLTDAGLLAHIGNSSVARLHQLKAAGDTGAMFIRGPRSLGSRLVALGVPAVPSDDTPAPLVGEEYFSGAYNTQRHGSRGGGAVDAIQVECHYTGIRDTAASREAFAAKLVTALLGMLDDYYGWTPPSL